MMLSFQPKAELCLVEHATMCLSAVVMTETQPSQQTIFPPAPVGLEWTSWPLAHKISLWPSLCSSLSYLLVKLTLQCIVFNPCIWYWGSGQLLCICSIIFSHNFWIVSSISWWSEEIPEVAVIHELKAQLIFLRQGFFYAIKCAH